MLAGMFETRCRHLAAPAAMLLCLALAPAAALGAPRGPAGPGPEQRAAAQPERRIEIAVGGQEIVDMPKAPSRIAVGRPEIADVALLRGGQIRVLGMKPGTTDLVVWNGNLRTAFDIAVTGNLDALRRGTAADPDLAGVLVEADGSRAVLRGRVPSVEAHRRLMALARAQVDDQVVDLTKVEGDQIVAVEVKFAAVSTRTLKSLGFDFRSLGTNFQVALSAPGALRGFSYPGRGAGITGLSQGPALSNAFNLLIGHNPNNILAGISALAETDLAQILAEPTLLVRSGESANFIAGGEIPIPVPQGGISNTITIEYKPFGVRLDIAPVVLSADRIVLRVAPEVSELDYGNALSLQGFNIPAIRKRATSTTVELGDGQSFVLAGLTMSTNSNTDERLPGLGDLPIIGALFKRVNHTREAQELIIVATPRLVRPVDKRNLPPLPGAAVRAYAPTTGDMLLGRNSADDAIARFGLMR